MTTLLEEEITMRVLVLGGVCITERHLWEVADIIAMVLGLKDHTWISNKWSILLWGMGLCVWDMKAN